MSLCENFENILNIWSEQLNRRQWDAPHMRINITSIPSGKLSHSNLLRLKVFNIFIVNAVNHKSVQCNQLIEFVSFSDEPKTVSLPKENIAWEVREIWISICYWNDLKLHFWRMRTKLWRCQSLLKITILHHFIPQRFRVDNNNTDHG